MKIYAKSNSLTNNQHTRGTSYKVTGEKRKLRDIVDTIYDEVEDRGLIDYFANIKSAGRKYYIDYFRFKSGWMLENTAKEFSDKLEDLIGELGFSDVARVDMIPEASKYFVDKYGGTVYTVRVIVGT